jgi:hypothetical protein
LTHTAIGPKLPFYPIRSGMNGGSVRHIGRNRQRPYTEALQFAQPVPPIYQPEVAARAIYFGAFHPRRHIWVGLPTVKAILANRIAPGLLDHYLPKSGYDSQLTDEPIDAAHGDEASHRALRAALGEIGFRWGGVNRTVAQIHALLYLTGRPMGIARLSSIPGNDRDLFPDGC